MLPWLAMVGVLVALPTFAQDDKAGSDERDPALAQWRWFVPLERPKDDAGKYVAVELPGPVLGKSAQGLSDLRLVDAKGQRVPYVLRVERTTNIQANVQVRRFNAGPDPNERYYQESYEVMAVEAPGYNEIEIRTGGSNFRRRVEVFAADDQTLSDASSLLPKESYVWRFQGDDRVAEKMRFHFDHRRNRYLRVRVYPDPARNEKPAPVGEVIVRRADKIVGKYITYPVQLEGPTFVRAGQGPGTAWFLKLGDEPTYCEEITLDVHGEGGVDRPTRIEHAELDQPRFDVGHVELRWRIEKDKEPKHLDLFFDEQFAQRLRLTITDFGNPAFQFGTKATGMMAARRIVFERPKADAWPMKLFFGNPEVTPPNYDLARRLPSKLEPEPALATIGVREANPAYVPPPPKFSDEHPLAVYLLLGVACLVLAGLLLPLARQALAQASAKQPPDLVAEKPI
jgi:hypothetical protein